jgi:hypothetical protein
MVKMFLRQGTRRSIRQELLGLSRENRILP